MIKPRQDKGVVEKKAEESAKKPAEKEKTEKPKEPIKPTEENADKKNN